MLTMEEHHLLLQPATQLPKSASTEKYQQASKGIAFKEAALLSHFPLLREKGIEGNGSQAAEYQARRLLAQLPFHVG